MTDPRYKFANAHEWLLSAYPDLPAPIVELLYTVDADTIQDHFQSQMGDDGYFDDMNATDDEEDDESDD